MFGIITVFSVPALLLVLSLHRYHNIPRKKSEGSSGRLWEGYFPWLGSRLGAWFKAAGGEYVKKCYHSWITQRYPASQRWIFICLGLSFCYLTLSGFVFVFLGSTRLFGLILLLHVVLGGLFAVCLCLAVILRARYYMWDGEDAVQKQNTADFKTRMGKRSLWQILLFWAFVASGVVLMVTALLQMLPQFSLRTQMVIFEIHRYAALEILLAGMALFYFSMVANSHEE